MRAGSRLAVALLVRKSFQSFCDKFVRKKMKSVPLCARICIVRGRRAKAESANFLVLPLSLSTYSTMREFASAQHLRASEIVKLQGIH